MKKTIKFEIVTGINKGYFHNNEYKNNLEMVSNIWQYIAGEEFDVSGIYVSAVLYESKTVYNTKWGCPCGGEDTVIITGIANPEFIKDIDLWKEVVLKLTKKLKHKLQQTTITCQFTEAELFYIKD